VQSAFRDTFQNVFDTSISPATAAIKKRMEDGPRIGTEFDISFGIKTGDDGKFLFHFQLKKPIITITYNDGGDLWQGWRVVMSF